MADNQNHGDGSDGQRDGSGNGKRGGTPDARTLVEVYHTDNDLAAGFVVDEILRPAGIDAYQHERRSRSIMAPASMPGEIGIAVPSHQAAAARQRLIEARQDGVLPDGGELI